MSVFYYEQIVGDMLGINPEELSQKNRDGSYVLGRQFCMVYRNEVLKMTTTAAGKRYGLNHATVIYSAKKIQIYKETKDIRYLQWKEFLDKCRIRLNSFTDPNFQIDNPQEVIDKQIEEKGFKGFMTDAAYSFNRLVSLIINDENEDEIRTQLELCHRKIHELKYLYE